MGKKNRKASRKGLAIMIAIPLGFIIAMLSGCGLVGAGYSYNYGNNRGWMPYRNNAAYGYTPAMPMAAPGTMIPAMYNARPFFGGSVYAGSRYDPNMAPYMAAMDQARQQAKMSVVQQPTVTMVPAPVSKNDATTSSDGANASTGNGHDDVMYQELLSQNKRVAGLEDKGGIAPPATTPPPTPAPAPAQTPAPAPTTPNK